MTAPPGKRCPKCDMVKSGDEFHRDSRRKSGLASWCKTCACANARRWRDSDTAGIEARRRERYRADPGPAIERSRTWSRVNRQRVRSRAADRYAATSEHRKARAAQYRADHPDQARSAIATARAKRPEHYQALSARRAARRRARLAGAPAVPYTPQQLVQRWRYFGGRCWMCDQPATALDHVKPLVAGGWDVLSNLRPACAPCNGRKSGRWPYPTRRRAREPQDATPGHQGGRH